MLEVADIIVIHKADLPGADQAAAQVRAALDLASGSSVPVFKVSSRTMDGVGSLWSAVANVPLRQRARTDDDRALLRAMLADVEHRYARAAEDRRLRELVDGWRGGALDRRTAAAALLRLLYEDTRDND